MRTPNGKVDQTQESASFLSPEFRVVELEAPSNGDKRDKRGKYRRMAVGEPLETLSTQVTHSGCFLRQLNKHLPYIVLLGSLHGGDSESRSLGPGVGTMKLLIT